MKDDIFLKEADRCAAKRASEVKLKTKAKDVERRRDVLWSCLLIEYMESRKKIH